MLGAGALQRWLLAGSLVPCLVLAGLLHFGFAHYRDAVSALDASQAAAILDLDDIDAAAGEAGAGSDPHPPPPLRVEEAVIGELRAQFLWWRPGASVVDHPADLPADDHSADAVRQLAAGSVGYRAENEALVMVEDPFAGRFEGWRSVLLLGVGFAALLLAAWKWFGGREPIPHFARLHGAREATARALQEQYERSLGQLSDEERRHRQRLGDAESELLALGSRLAGLDAVRTRVLARETQLLKLAAAGGGSAIEDFRELGRQRRLSSDPLPVFLEFALGASVFTPRRGRRVPLATGSGAGAVRGHGGGGTGARRECRPCRLRGASICRGAGAARSGGADSGRPPASSGPSRRRTAFASGREGGPSRAQSGGGIRPPAGDRVLTIVRLCFALLVAALCASLTGCAAEMDPCADWPAGLPPQTVVVVMDATDGLSRPQREDMWSRIRPVADRAPAGSVFHLFEVRSEAPGGVRELGVVRRPPHPCEVNHWSDNPDQRAAQWAPRYLQPLRDALGTMSRAAPSDSSAILQALSAAARPFGESPAAEGRLILVSDLLHNVGVDFYRGVPDFDRFRESALYREVTTRWLAGVRLTVLQLPPRREGWVDEAALRRFWTAYFTDQGMLDVETAFLPVEGARQ